MLMDYLTIVLSLYDVNPSTPAPSGKGRGWIRLAEAMPAKQVITPYKEISNRLSPFCYGNPSSVFCVPFIL